MNYNLDDISYTAQIVLEVRNSIVDQSFDWDHWDLLQGFSSVQVARNWISHGLKFEDPELVACVLDQFKVPCHLTLKERIAFFQLISDEA